METEGNQRTMPRTAAQQVAAKRDGPFCMWCKQQGRLIEASDVHHILRRKVDVPEACISLCHTCHIAGNHTGKEPTKKQLVDIMLELYGYDLRAMYPQFSKV